MIPQIQHRHNLGSFLLAHGLDTSGVEVGCAFGGLSKMIMDQCGKIKLFMVDPYARQSPSVYLEEGVEVKPYEQWFKEVSDLPSHGYNCEIIRDYSLEAVKRFSDGKLDFVYLDGNHARKSVEADIQAWWPKVRSGGLFGGHDYSYVNPWSDVFGAVTEWTIREQLPFVVCPCTSWFLFKP